MPSDSTRGGESPAGERLARLRGAPGPPASAEVTPEEQGWLSGDVRESVDLTKRSAPEPAHSAPGAPRRTFWSFGG